MLHAHTPTIKDVARRARVGVSTVSRVLNKHVDVGAETRDKVLKVARQLNYRPHSGARQLATDSAETICFVMSNRDVINPFHSKILFGVEEYARRVSHNVVFMRFDFSPSTLPTALELPRVIWERAAVDGVIIAGTNYPNFVHAIKALGVHCVLLGNNLVGRMAFGDIDTIWFDDEGGVRGATEYLIKLGHRDIWFAGDLTLPWYRRCHRGYRTAMTNHHLKPEVLTGQSGLAAYQYGVTCAEQISGLKDRVSAIMAGDDDIALGILSNLARFGIKVPQDVSLVGCDDIDAIKYFHPPLTTVRVPKVQVGEELAKALFDRLSNPQLAPIKRVIATELVIRDSCAEPHSTVVVTDSLAPAVAPSALG